MIQLTGSSHSLVFFFRHVIPTSTASRSARPGGVAGKKRRLTKVGSAQVLTSEDQHDEADREEKGRHERDETRVLGSKLARSALDQLDDHCAET